MEIIYLFCAAILFFLGASFLLKQRKNQADYIILVWILIEIFTQLSYYLLATSGVESNIVFFQIISGTNLLHAPLFYLYVVALLDKKFAFTLGKVILFVPALLFYVVHLPAFSDIIGSSACSTHYSCYLMNKPCSILFNISKLILNTFYLTITFFTYLTISSRNEMLSYHQKINRDWVRFLLIIVFVISFLILVIILSKISRIEVFSSEVYVLNFISAAFVMFACFVNMNLNYIAYYINKIGNYFKKVKLDNVKLLDEYPVAEPEGSKNPKPSIYEDKDFTLSQELLNKYQSLIIQCIEEKTPYLDHHLTKEKFSNKLGIPEHHLAIVLKVRFQKNFTDFINSYRLQALIEKLQNLQNETFTLLGLAYDCGFNSKSTFNRFFKSQMGVTPSDWLKTTHLSEKIEAIHKEM